MSGSVNISQVELSTGGGGSCGAGSLTGPLGLFVQGLLAFIAFSALIVKRFCEPPKERRPWIIWFFDTSKQAIGATVIHFSNVFLSEIFHGDPCTWYIISFLLDSTIGLLIICIGLKVCLCVIKQRGLNHLVFGHYGYPAECKAWSGQCVLYVIIVVVEKLLMTLLLLFDFWKHVRMFILYPVSDPTLRLVIVMFIIPLVVNALVFWIVDNYLKDKNWKADQQTYMTTIEAGVSSNHVARLSNGKRFASYSRVQLMDSGENEDFLSMEEDSGVDVVPRSGLQPSQGLHRTAVAGREHYTLLDPGSVNDTRT